ncbi:hypothetical protein ACN42_g10206 [Penicillium freii]|uniref:Uncharacterized protein n=1 Tax=Penicillium freii TaxID=48697 RepID=A0A101MAG9_PENFR|nr:hypothetical protein ACN42_g10206 [Penicillium freii]
MRTKHDPTLKYIANVVDFGEHSNNKIQRAVLPRTESGYSDTLLIFDEYIPIVGAEKQSLNRASITSFITLYP